MQKIIAALALVSLAGCALSPGSLVLVFPSDQDKANAAHATIIEVRPMSATDDQCPRYLQFAEPDPNQIESSTTLDLNNGVPSQEIKHVPNGYQTLLVKVTNAQTNLILHGCRSGDVGGKFEIDLVDVNQAPPDLSPNGDGAVDLLPPPNDMTMHKYLQITATEMRLSTRKLSGVVITLKDSGTSTQTLPPTDSTGTVKIDTLGMTPPFTITASAPVSNGYQGASTLTGVNPTFVSDTIVMSIPVELDPPATSAANAINVTVADGAGQNFTAYYIGTNSVIGDQLSLPWTGAATFAVQPLATGSYRLAVLDPAQSKIATTNALLSSGQTYMPQLTGGLNPSDFKAYSATFSLGLVHSTNAAYVSTESYGVLLILPSSQTQAAIPIVPETGFTTTGSVGTTVVPAMPSTIQASAVLLTEMIAFGPTARGELRHQLASPTPASDSFGTAVPDPPAVTVTTPVPSASAITITATPPGSFPISSAFVHVHIHATTPQNYHWHLVAPAGNPTTFVAPGGVIPAGTYSVDTAFVQDFTLADGTVQATLTDDYTKLIRVVPQQLSQSTSTLTVN